MHRAGRTLGLVGVAAALGAGAGAWWAIVDDEAKHRPGPPAGSSLAAGAGREPVAGAGEDPAAEARWAAERRAMVREQLERRGVRSSAVLEAMERVPRHRFVPESVRHLAYDDGPLPIGHQQTISQPYIVALMTEALGLRRGDRVLEVGTGSGYQAAIVAEITGQVHTIEIVEPLAREAESTLRALGYSNVHVRIGDGYQGWPEHAPFDAIIVTAAPDHVPQPLLAQLKIGGRLVIPIGRGEQDLWLLTKKEDGVKRRALSPVRFVPMTGEAERTVH